MSSRTAERVDAVPRSIAAFGAGLRSGTFTAAEMTERALAAAERSQATVNAFITITAELAAVQAAAVDWALAHGRDAGPLMGVPVGIKDLIDVGGVPTTAGSRSLADNVAERDAPVVARLVDAGAVVIGKTNMDQFAFGPHQDDYGRTTLPADGAYYAGGSSGGSAAAVAAGCVLAALGSDAGGSARFPASCCGVTGFKPSFGRVPAGGIAPTFWSLDHVAPIAGSVADVEAICAVAADGWAPRRPLGRPPRLGVQEGWPDGCDATVAGALARAFDGAARAGAELFENRAVAGLEGWSRMLMATVAPEAAVALSPYDAAAIPAALHEILAAGRALPATEYVAAQRERAALRDALDEALTGLDALALPTSLSVAWRWDEIDSSDMGVRNAATMHLPAANLTGHPAISIPVASDGLPVGLQLIGHRHGDEALLEVAGWLERRLAGLEPGYPSASLT
jgi:aspartyl-tRNA(Asn)/glutamyl-tRNA(Gln) amidotransferase subunit A